MKAKLLHPGTQHSHHLARQLYRLGVLDQFITSFAVSDEAWLGRLFRKPLKGRLVSNLPARVIKSYPLVEAMSRWDLLTYENPEMALYRRNARFQDKVIDNDLSETDLVIGFDTSSWKVSTYCLKEGKRFVLDVTIGHSKAKEETYARFRADYPEWNESVPLKSAQLVELEQMEFDQARRIVVPSAFVRKTLVDNGVSAEKIHINPFGTSLQPPDRSVRRDNGKTTFLFFGSLTARKGLPVLLKAWDRIANGKFELILAGYGQIPVGVRIPDNVRILGPIAPASRAALYGMADVFVFPSFFEGLAQVLIEAAVCGLPIIATPNSGAEEIVKDGYSGLMVTEGDITGLARAMAHLGRNHTEIETMGERIRQDSAIFTWNNYGDRWKQMLDKIANT